MSNRHISWQLGTNQIRTGNRRGRKEGKVIDNDDEDEQSEKRPRTLQGRAGHLSMSFDSSCIGFRCILARRPPAHPPSSAMHAKKEKKEKRGRYDRTNYGDGNGMWQITCGSSLWEWLVILASQRRLFLDVHIPYPSSPSPSLFSLMDLVARRTLSLRLSFGNLERDQNTYFLQTNKHRQ